MYNGLPIAPWPMPWVRIRSLTRRAGRTPATQTSGCEPKGKYALKCSVEGVPRQQGGGICKNTGTCLWLPISTPPELVRRPPYGPLQSKPRRYCRAGPVALTT